MKAQQKLLTMKERKFITAYIESGGNGTAAAQEAYDVSSKEAASVLASRNLKKPAIADALRAEMERQGITLEKIIGPIARGLTATDEDGEHDYRTQLAAHDRAIKLLGLTDRQGKDSPNINFNINNAKFGGEFVQDEED